MKCAITNSALGSSFKIAKATIRLASTHTPSQTNITDTTCKPVAPEPTFTTSPTNVTDGTGKLIRPIETKSTPPPAPETTSAYPEAPSTSVPPEVSASMNQIDIETLNMTPSSVPNAKPAGVSEWVHNMVGQSKTMQCLLYGVQNPVDKPGR